MKTAHLSSFSYSFLHAGINFYILEEESWNNFTSTWYFCWLWKLTDENLFERKEYSRKSYETNLEMSKISQHFTHNDTWWIYIRDCETIVSFFTTYVCSLLWGSWTPKSSIPTVSQSRFNWFLIGSLSPGIKKSSGVLKLTVVQGKYGLEQSTV